MPLLDAIQNALFYVFAAASVGLALAVVSTRHILRAAVYLMGVLIVSAGFYALLHAQFLAGVQILVYVGGIVVLLVFAVMLTSTTELLDDTPSPARKLVGGGVAILFFLLSVALFALTDFPLLQEGRRPPDDTAALGLALLDSGAEGYVLPFELISLLLLGAVIGGIVLARKRTTPENAEVSS